MKKQLMSYLGHVEPKIETSGFTIPPFTSWLVGVNIKSICFNPNESVGTLEFESVFTGVTCKLWE